MAVNCTPDRKTASRRLHSRRLGVSSIKHRPPSCKATPGPLSALARPLSSLRRRRCHRWRYWNYIQSTKGWEKTFINAHDAPIVLPVRLISLPKICPTKSQAETRLSNYGPIPSLPRRIVSVLVKRLYGDIFLYIIFEIIHFCLMCFEVETEN